MFTNRFVTELDRPGIVPDGALFMYAYATGADADGFAFTYAVGITGPDQPLDGDYARFKSADDAIRFVAAWFTAQDGTACFALLSDLGTRARELARIENSQRAGDVKVKPERSNIVVDSRLLGGVFPEDADSDKTFTEDGRGNWIEVAR